VEVAKRDLVEWPSFARHGQQADCRAQERNHPIGITRGESKERYRNVSGQDVSLKIVDARRLAIAREIMTTEESARVYYCLYDLSLLRLCQVAAAAG
jgi:hypothetical protein